MYDTTTATVEAREVDEAYVLTVYISGWRYLSRLAFEAIYREQMEKALREALRIQYG